MFLSMATLDLNRHSLPLTHQLLLLRPPSRHHHPHRRRPCTRATSVPGRRPYTHRCPTGTSVTPCPGAQRLLYSHPRRCRLWPPPLPPPITTTIIAHSMQSRFRHLHPPDLQPRSLLTFLLSSSSCNSRDINNKRRKQSLLLRPYQHRPLPRQLLQPPLPLTQLVQLLPLPQRTRTRTRLLCAQQERMRLLERMRLKELITAERT